MLNHWGYKNLQELWPLSSLRLEEVPRQGQGTVTVNSGGWVWHVLSGEGWRTHVSHQGNPCLKGMVNNPQRLNGPPWIFWSKKSGYIMDILVKEPATQKKDQPPRQKWLGGCSTRRYGSYSTNKCKCPWGPLFAQTQQDYTRLLSQGGNDILHTPPGFRFLN